MGAAELPGQAQPTAECVRKIRPKKPIAARPAALTSLVIRSLKESTYRTKQGHVRVALNSRGGRAEPRMTLPAQLPLSRGTGTRPPTPGRGCPGPLRPPAPTPGAAGSWKPGGKILRSSGPPPGAPGPGSGAAAAQPRPHPRPPALQGRAGVETPGARRGGRAALGGRAGTAGRHRGAAPSPPRPGPAPAELGAGRRGGGGRRAGPEQGRARPGGAGRAAGLGRTLSFTSGSTLSSEAMAGPGSGPLRFPGAHTGNDLTPRARQCRARPPPA